MTHQHAPDRDNAVDPEFGLDQHMNTTTDCVADEIDASQLNPAHGVADLVRNARDRHSVLEAADHLEVLPDGLNRCDPAFGNPDDDLVDQLYGWATRLREHAGTTRYVTEIQRALCALDQPQFNAEELRIISRYEGKTSDFATSRPDFRWTEHGPDATSRYYHDYAREHGDAETRRRIRDDLRTWTERLALIDSESELSELDPRGQHSGAGVREDDFRPTEAGMLYQLFERRNVEYTLHFLNEAAVAYLLGGGS